MIPKINQLVLLVNILLKKYFLSFYCWNILADDIFLDVEIKHPFLTLNFSQPLHDPLYKLGCHGFIIYTNNPKKVFDSVEYAIRFIRGTKFHDRRYLFVPIEEYKEDIFESDKLEYVADLVLVKDVGEQYEFWTNKFGGVKNHNEKILLDRWFKENKTFQSNVNLYPDKIKNQDGRALRISTFDYKPYINIDSGHGIELMMTKEYAKLCNMGTKIIIEKEFWGVFYEENYTATGAKGTLLTDKADISLGSWYRLPNYTKFVDLTDTTVRLGVTFLVPAPKLASGWFTPMLSFSTSLWIGFVLTFVGLTISMTLYDDFYQRVFLGKDVSKIQKILIKWTELTAITQFLQQPTQIFQDVPYLRKMLISMLISTLFFGAVYSAGFSSIMTIPIYADSIKDSNDLDASGIKWGAIHPALLDGFRELKKYQHVVQNIIILNNQEIRHRMHIEDFAMLADRVPNGLVIADRIDVNDVDRYRVINDDLYSDQCVLLVKRSSVLIPSIYKAFLSMKEAGLLYFWEMQAFYEENYPAQNALKNQKQENLVVKLQWKHVQGAFGMLWIGLLISLLAFIVEFRYYKHKEKNIISKITNKRF